MPAIKQADALVVVTRYRNNKWYVRLASAEGDKTVGMGSYCNLGDLTEIVERGRLLSAWCFKTSRDYTKDVLRAVINHKLKTELPKLSVEELKTRLDSLTK